MEQEIEYSVPYMEGIDTISIESNFDLLPFLGLVEVLRFVNDYTFLYESGCAGIFGPGTKIPGAAIEILEILLEAISYRKKI